MAATGRVYNFNYYLSDTYNSSEFTGYLISQGIPSDVAETIAEVSPFGEVGFKCKYDSGTGELKIKLDR